MPWAVSQQHCTQAAVQAWVSVGTGCDSPGDGYLQPLELLAAEEAFASGLEEDYLLRYQLVALLLQPGHHARLQEHLTASRGHCAPSRGSETPAGSSGAQRWGTWLPSTLQDWPLLSPSLPLLCPASTSASSTARCCKPPELFLWDTALLPRAAWVTSVPLLRRRSQHVHTCTQITAKVAVYNGKNKTSHVIFFI